MCLHCCKQNKITEGVYSDTVSEILFLLTFIYNVFSLIWWYQLYKSLYNTVSGSSSSDMDDQLYQYNKLENALMNLFTGSYMSVWLCDIKCF